MTQEKIKELLAERTNVILHAELRDLRSDLEQEKAEIIRLEAGADHLLTELLEIQATAIEAQKERDAWKEAAESLRSECLCTEFRYGKDTVAKFAAARVLESGEV